MAPKTLGFKHVFFIVPARDGWCVSEKIRELEELQVPYIIVCGEHMDLRNVVYREARGKWDAINFGSRYIPTSTDVVVLNDVGRRLSGSAFETHGSRIHVF